MPSALIFDFRISFIVYIFDKLFYYANREEI